MLYMSVAEKASSAVNGHIHEQSRVAAFDGQKLMMKTCEDGVCKSSQLDGPEKIRRYILEKQPHALTLLQRLQGLRRTHKKKRRSLKKSKKSQKSKKSKKSQKSKKNNRR